MQKLSNYLRSLRFNNSIKRYLNLRILLRITCISNEYESNKNSEKVNFINKL